MITYHQAFDIYHTIFRIIKILEKNSNKKFEKDRLRIFDFYLLFPHDFHYVKVPMAAKFLKTSFKETKYNSLPDRVRIFYQIGKFFDLSLQCLVSYEIIDPQGYANNIIELANVEKVKEILEIQTMQLDDMILTALTSHFSTMSLTELKQRTGLIEYRYDVPQA